MSLLENLINKYKRDTIIGSVLFMPAKDRLLIEFLKHGESDNELVLLTNVPKQEQGHLIDGLRKAWMLTPDKKNRDLLLSPYYTSNRIYEIALKIADRIGHYSHCTTLDLGTKFFIKADFEQDGKGTKQKIDFSFPFKLERDLVLSKVQEILKQM